MSFNNKKNNNLQEAPLGYWEEKSYMSIIPRNQSENLISEIFQRLENKGINILEKRELTEEAPGYMKISYEDEDYEIVFYPSDFQLYEPFLINTSYKFNETDIEELRNARNSLIISMEFNQNSQKSYHLQLKIAYAISPDMLALLDESAEKLLPQKWVEMAANSNIVPGPNDLYTVQAVSETNGELWLHTHGLCRCGLTELEILESNNKNYENHYNLISTFATFLINNPEFNPRENGVRIGLLSDTTPIVVTCRSWTEALQNEYPNLFLGGNRDRESGHNSRTSVIFLYKTKQDEENHKISKVSDYDKRWGDNLVFFITNEETARMKALAIERFNFVKEQLKNKDNKIIIKIGLVTDDNSLEHIWFELLEFEHNYNFIAKLIQEPYNVSKTHEGDIMSFTANDITDWIIYTKDFSVNPGNVYLLK